VAKAFPAASRCCGDEVADACLVRQGRSVERMSLFGLVFRRRLFVLFLLLDQVKQGRCKPSGLLEVLIPLSLRLSLVLLCSSEAVLGCESVVSGVARVYVGFLGFAVVLCGLYSGAYRCVVFGRFAWPTR
jgi:hypothetical protein